MKKLALALVGTLSLIGFSQTSAYLDYSPNCIPNPDYPCNYDFESNNQENKTTTPTTPTTPPTQPSKPTTPIQPNKPTTPTSPTTPSIPSQNQGKEAGVYIYYESVEGHNIYAGTLYKGKGGETVDLSSFMKELTTFEFDHYRPEQTITLESGKYLRGKLIYRKKFREVQNTQNYSQPQKQTSQPSSSETNQRTSSETTKQNSTSQEQVSTSQSSTNQSSAETKSSNTDVEKQKVFTALFDDYFRRNSMTSLEKQLFLTALKTNFQNAQKTVAKDHPYYATYSLIISAIENYRF